MVGAGAVAELGLYFLWRGLSWIGVTVAGESDSHKSKRSGLLFKLCTLARKKGVSTEDFKAAVVCIWVVKYKCIHVRISVRSVSLPEHLTLPCLNQKSELKVYSQDRVYDLSPLARLAPFLQAKYIHIDLTPTYHHYPHNPRSLSSSPCPRQPIR